jgi:[NiFe] hydrogenase diaphorase moiety large subunit
MNKDKIIEIIDHYHRDSTRLMDILIDIQVSEGRIPAEAIPVIAHETGKSEAFVEQTVSFYHFFHHSNPGEYAIFLNNSVVSRLMGRDKVAGVFEEEAGCRFGEVTGDGKIGLFETACIGMSDQEPAALINGKVFSRLTTFRAREIIRYIKEGKSLEELSTSGYGGGMNASDLIRSEVRNNVHRRGPVLDENYVVGNVIRNKLKQLSPEEVIWEIKLSQIRGRGGAGFPTGMKWEFCRKVKGDKKYIFCNADEGEPGTFKDRVILTELPKLMFEGMALAGYAIGADEGILYIRYEYKYLEQYLEDVLAEMRKGNLLGKNIAGIEGFHFDIRIQYGAGAYVCGEESALLESAEGKRGEPRPRPPFPVEKGYLGMPTVVNNVETLCTAVKIIEFGSEWYRSLGTKESKGTKILSISGDCRFPGIYEMEWGYTIHDILDMVGAEDVQAVQVGGPSGSIVGPEEFDRQISYEDLATGGSFMIFHITRDLLRDVVLNFMEFFIDESCGSCVPCRNIPVLLKQKLEKIIYGHGVWKDLEDIEQWTKIMAINRCGLGQTSANPVITSLKHFRALYEEKLQRGKSFDEGFDLEKAVAESCDFVGRIPAV